MATPVMSPEQRTAAPPRAARKAGQRSAPVLSRWVTTQSINVTRHAAALRPFRPDEFGTGAAAPSVATAVKPWH